MTLKDLCLKYFGCSYVYCVKLSLAICVVQSYSYVIHAFHVINKMFFFKKGMKNLSSNVSFKLEVLMSSGVSKSLVSCQEMLFLCEIKFHALVMRLGVNSCVRRMEA